MTKFNTQQLQAINFYKGACAVVAGAGSGKSSVLVERIKNLVNTHSVSQHDILAISFTNKTATELKNKLKKIGLENVNVGTFHAICSRILLQENIKVHGKLVSEWKAENWFKTIDQKPNTADILSFISYQKNYRKTPSDNFVEKESDYTEEELREFYKIYESMKDKEGLFDFDDHLLMCLDILESNKGKYSYEFILVDEHQDSNFVQNRILQELCQSGNMFACFDARQAIYSFRGGNPEYCLNFEKYWNNPTIINMFINYRSTNNIVKNANKFIRPYFKNYKHYVDSEANIQSNGHISINTYTDREDEGVEVVDKIEELITKGEDLNEIAVLYRLNSHSSYVENELKKRNIEYDIANDSSFFKRKEVNGIMSYLRMIHNPHDDNAFENVFRLRNYPLTFFSGKLFDEVRKQSGLNNMSLYEAFINMKYDKPWQQKAAKEFETNINKLKLQKDKNVSVVTLITNIVKSFKIETFIKDNYSDREEINDRLNSIEVLKSFVKNNNLEQFITYVYSTNTKKKVKKNAVRLMSVHSSKGLEWNNVFLIGVEDDKFPHERSSVDEEARLFYVGITRSKENLYISEIKNDNSNRNLFIKEYFGDSIL